MKEHARVAYIQLTEKELNQIDNASFAGLWKILEEVRKDKPTQYLNEQ